MMKRANLPGMMLVVFLFLLTGGVLYAASDLCNTVDMKPVLSLQQVRQAEFVHYLCGLSGIKSPSPEGKTPEQLCKEETQLLIDAGFPSALAGVEPDRLVTRRYFCNIMYPLACDCNSQFNAKYGGLTDETQQLKALVEAEWLYAEEGRLYREEVLSILCSHQFTPTPKAAVEVPLWIPTEGTIAIESPVSPN